jgi:mannosyl-oligosaccharide alpha-1,2-mannosidase
VLFQGEVNLFEMTIRVIGGLLAAYELRGTPVLLQRAREVADIIIIAFNT